MSRSTNLYADGDRYLFGRYSSPITVSGATVVVAAKPTRNGGAVSREHETTWS